MYTAARAQHMLLLLLLLLLSSSLLWLFSGALVLTRRG